METCLGEICDEEWFLNSENSFQRENYAYNYSFLFKDKVCLLNFGTWDITLEISRNSLLAKNLLDRELFLTDQYLQPFLSVLYRFRINLCFEIFEMFLNIDILKFV